MHQRARFVATLERRHVYTCGCVAGTHGDVLNVHTEVRDLVEERGGCESGRRERDKKNRVLTCTRGSPTAAARRRIEFESCK